LQHVCFAIGSLLSTWVVALHAAFDQYLDEAVVTLHQDCITSNYRNYLQATWHISLPLVTSKPRTDTANPGNIKLLNWSGPV